MVQSISGFGFKLGRVMAGCNLSRVALAHELGVNKSVIARWLAGVNQPTDHNLARLTQLLRRHRSEITLDFWRDDDNGLTSAPVSGTGAGGLSITGLRGALSADTDALYTGLWAGFYQSTQNRGSVVLCAMAIEQDDAGLRAVFTDGRVTAEGRVLAIGMRVHAILELGPRHDRLCMFVFNGIGTPDAVMIEGVYLISAGESEVSATSAPILLIRLGDRGDYDAAGQVAEIMEKIHEVNARAIRRSIEAGDPVAGFAHIAPASVLSRVCPRVGVALADGETDHVLRMPAHRALPHGRFGAAELPATSPVRQTLANLRRLFALPDLWATAAEQSDRVGQT